MTKLMTAVLTVVLGCLMGSVARAGDLDLGQYVETFSETFRERLDVTPWGPSRWIAHTPWKGDFGDSRFADPRGDFPFRTGPDGLTITARKNAAGKWESGLLSSRDAHGRGFQQVGGYFEVRMKMPPGPGVWPAFWLASEGDGQEKIEIDIVEYYGHRPERYHVTVHRWPKLAKGAPPPAVPLKHTAVNEHIYVPANVLTEGFHTYGVDVGTDVITFYLDRKEVWRTPSPASVSQPLMLLVNLALGPGWPIDKTPDPSVLLVDYVKAYRKK